jgi:guanylate cyclase
MTNRGNDKDDDDDDDDDVFLLQILNRTNNIFELVTVEPVLTERPSDRKRDIVLLSDESDGLPDDKTLRLKGMRHKYEDMRLWLVFF